HAAGSDFQIFKIEVDHRCLRGSALSIYTFARRLGEGCYGGQRQARDRANRHVSSIPDPAQDVVPPKVSSYVPRKLSHDSGGGWRKMPASEPKSIAVLSYLAPMRSATAREATFLRSMKLISVLNPMVE